MKAKYLTQEKKLQCYHRPVNKESTECAHHQAISSHSLVQMIFSFMSAKMFEGVISVIVTLFEQLNKTY